MWPEKAYTLAQNKFLHSFGLCHIKFVLWTTPSGECASADGEVVDDWQARLPNLTEGYEARDIYNMDKTGIVFRALPDRSHVIKG